MLQILLKQDLLSNSNTDSKRFNYITSQFISSSYFVYTSFNHSVLLISDQYLDQPVYLRLHEQRFQKSFSHITRNKGHGPEPSCTGLPKRHTSEQQHWPELELSVSVRERLFFCGHNRVFPKLPATQN